MDKNVKPYKQKGDTCAIVCMLMVLEYYKKIGLNIIYFWKQIIKFVPALIVPSISGFMILKYIKYDNIFIFVTFIIVYILIYCLSMWFLGMNEYEKQLILSPIMKVIKNNNKK